MSTPQSPVLKGSYIALAVATIAFTTNFWAWGLLSPLAPRLQDLLSLSPIQVSVMVATPILLGSIARIPLGALTDRYGGRSVFAVLSLVVVAPLVFLAFFQTFPSLLIGGLFVGLSGASFAVGVPFVNAWFPPERRGFALGVYGIGNMGTAIAGFTAPRLADEVSPAAPFLVVAAVVLATAAVVVVAGRDAPGRSATTPAVAQTPGGVESEDHIGPLRSLRPYLRRVRRLRRLPAHVPAGGLRT